MARRRKAKSPKFPQFKGLPAELRDEIWYEALSAVPKEDGSALFPYRGGSWQTQRPPKSNPLLDNWGECTSEVNFYLDMLDVEVNVPLATLDREVNRVAQDWAREKALDMRFRQDKQCHVISRPFDRENDILYVAPGELDDLYHNLTHRPTESCDYSDYESFVCSNRMDGVSLAVHQQTLRYEAETLADMFKEEYCPVGLNIIVDGAPDLDDNSTGVHERWVLETEKHRSFFWHQTRRSFELYDGTPLNKSKSCRRIQKDLKILANYLDIDTRLIVNLASAVRE
jgi:hypothetical protein